MMIKRRLGPAIILPVMSNVLASKAQFVEMESESVVKEKHAQTLKDFKYAKRNWQTSLATNHLSQSCSLKF